MNRIPIPAGMETECFILDSNALQDVPKVLSEIFPGRRPWIVADGNTWKAAGERVQNLLLEGGLNPHEPYLFPAEPLLHPENCYIETLVNARPAGAVPVAVGGGTINDLVKRSSEVAGTRYLCIPTTPSVDGYTSFGAAMLVDGLKKTLPCAAPLALVADTDVLRSAPPAMAAAGYADLFAKIPAGADWIIADAFGFHPIREDVWALVQKPLRNWLSDPADLHALLAGLAATGYAMQLCRDSRPASGAEHLISHVWEMEGVDASHGFKVAVGTLASTALMQEYFRLSPAELEAMAVPPRTRPEREQEIDDLLRPGVYGTEAREIALSKFREPAECFAFRREAMAKHAALGRRVEEQLIPFGEVREMFRRAGCPVHYREIGVELEQFLHAIRTAQLIRTRYTVLDLLYETGVFEALLPKIIPYFN